MKYLLRLYLRWKLYWLEGMIEYREHVLAEWMLEIEIDKDVHAKILQRLHDATPAPKLIDEIIGR